MGAALLLAGSHWRRHWLALAALGVAAGLVGGLALGAVAGARRSATAYERLVEAEGGLDAFVFLLDDPDAGIEAMRRLPGVERVDGGVIVIGRRAPTQNWYAIYAPVDTASVGTPLVTRGRVPAPDAGDELLITEATARSEGLDVGDRVVFRAYSHDQFATLPAELWDVPAGPQIAAEVVGVVQHTSDIRGDGGRVMFGSPALGRRLAGNAALEIAMVDVADLAVFRAGVDAIGRELGRGEVAYDVEDFGDQRSAVERTERVMVLGLGVFAGTVAIAGSLALAQAARRHLAFATATQPVLATLGMPRAERTAALGLALAPYLAVAVPVGVVAAWLTSPLFPLGDLGDLEPDPGLHTDTVVLLAGALVLAVSGAAFTALVAHRSSTTERRRARPPRGEPVVTRIERTGAPPPASVGAGFAVAPGRGTTGLPTRSAQVATLLAVALVAAAAVFTASAGHLVRTPARYGLDYDFMLELATPSADDVLTALAKRPDLDAVAGIWLGTTVVDGRSVPVFAMEARKGSIGPVYMEGRAPNGPSEIALGPELRADLGVEIGDRVSIGARPEAREAQIVGGAFAAEPGHSEFTAVAFVTPGLMRQIGSDVYREAAVRFRADVDRRDVIADLDRAYPYGVMDESAIRAPGEIRNLDQVRQLPHALGVFFVVLGGAALAHALVIAVRRRRRDLAVLRSLGFTARQSAATVAAMATTIALLGVAVGLPLGVWLGSAAWGAVAGELHVEPALAVPVLPVAATAAGAVVLANLVALVPARLAARQVPADGLRAE